MSVNLAERMWPACLSSLQLDRFRLLELPEREAEEVRAHLSSCAACSGAVAGLTTAEPLPPLRVRRLAPPRGRLVPALAGLAAAAAVLVALRSVPGERAKGSQFALGMYVQHQGEVRRAAPGEVAAPGDSLRFTASSPRASYLAVLSVDPRGAASIYFPSSARAEAIAAGADVALPLATRLDQTLGEERIVALFCDSPVELQPVREGLGSGRFSAPAGCQVVRWNFVKR